MSITPLVPNGPTFVVILTHDIYGEQMYIGPYTTQLQADQQATLWKGKGYSVSVVRSTWRSI